MADDVATASTLSVKASQAAPAKSPFGFVSVEHFFASAFHDLHVGLQAVEKEVPKIEGLAPEVEGLTELVPGYGSTAATIERAAFSALGAVLAPVAAADAAVSANGLSINFDAAAVAAWKSLLAQFKPQLASAGIKV